MKSPSTASTSSISSTAATVRRASVLALGAALVSGCGLLQPDRSATEWVGQACYSYEAAAVDDPNADAGSRLTHLDDAMQAATRAAASDPSWDSLVRGLQAARTASSPIHRTSGAGQVPAEAVAQITAACAKAGHPLPTPSAS